MEIAFLGLNVSEWAAGGTAVVVAGVIVAYLRKKGMIWVTKRFAQKATVVLKQIGEACFETADVFGEMDKAIKEDGHLIENSVKDIIREGKEAIVEWKDVIISIKPKK